MGYRKNKFCSIQGCGKPLNARGFCSMHYMRWRAFGDPMLETRPPGGVSIEHLAVTGVCAIEWCNEPQVAHGWCRTHHAAWRRNGDAASAKWQRFEPREWLRARVRHEEKDDCLTWPFARNGKGRSTVTMGPRDRYEYASRVMCELAHGAPPTPDHEAAHSCGKGHLGCINPHHLRWATPLENTHDKFVHGTTRPGEEHPNAILTENQARKIFELATAGDLSQRVIGELFGTSQYNVSQIKLAKTWRILHKDDVMTDTLRGLKPPKTLIFKIHSSGLFREDLPIAHEGQPVCVEISHMLIDENGKSGNINCNVVKSEGRISQQEAINIHGLTNWEINQVGAKETRVIGLISDLLKTLPYRHMRVVSFNEFDNRVVGAALARLGAQMNPQKDFSNLWLGRPLTEFVFLQNPWARLECKIDDGEGGYRKPSLQEAERIILGRDRTEGIFKDLPMALLDVLAIRDLWLKFSREGLMHSEAV